MPHVYQGFPPILLFNDRLHTYFVNFLLPVVNYSASSKTVGTVEVKHQTHWHSEGRSASGLMLIRGFFPYGYLMTVSTPICAFIIARCELFRVE